MALTATPNFELTLEEQCEAIWAATEERQVEMDAIRAKPPLIRFFDGRGDLQWVVRDDDEFSVDDIVNDTGPGSITFDFDRPVAQYLNDMYGRKKRGESINVLMVIDHCGGRWSGLLDVAEVLDADGAYPKLVATFLSDYEQLKWKQLWSSPNWPAAIQKRAFLLGGPTPWVILTSLFVNLWRENNSLWHLSDDPLKLSSWTSGLNMYNWPIVVKPLSFMEALASGAPMALMVSRWKTFHDAVQMMAEDGEYSITWRRWFTGDPLPWPGANIQSGTLVVGCEDQSGIYEGTANGGTWMDGFTRTFRQLSEDLYEDTEQAQTTKPVIADYRVPGRLNTNRRAPYVFFGPRSPGVTASSFKQSPAKGKQINTGGHSMPGVNETISAGIQAVFDIVGNLLQVGSIGGSVDSIARMFYEDTILAWISIKLMERVADQGRFGLFEFFVDSGGKAYTFSSFMVIRAGRWATRTWFAASMEIMDAAPYLVGDKGKGHFWKGDRVAVMIKGDLSRRLHVDRVRRLTLSRKRGQRAAYAIGVGNDAAQQDPLVKLMARAEKLKADVKELGFF
ncbi:hypothetical protein ABZU78_11855 [Rhodococcus erythropolis]|uniref:Gp37-like protein n=1 Tax=Rhodococcus erythropolis TaxID=1833 RepID=UPI0033A0658F